MHQGFRSGKIPSKIQSLSQKVVSTDSTGKTIVKHVNIKAPSRLIGYIILYNLNSSTRYFCKIQHIGLAKRAVSLNERKRDN